MIVGGAAEDVDFGALEPVDVGGVDCVLDVSSAGGGLLVVVVRRLGTATRMRDGIGQAQAFLLLVRRRDDGCEGYEIFGILKNLLEVDLTPGRTVVAGVHYTKLRVEVWASVRYVINVEAWIYFERSQVSIYNHELA